VNKTTVIITTTSIIPVAMLIIGIGIVMIPPMILEALVSYSPDNETIVEEAIDSPLMMSILPTLASALLVLGLIGIGVHALLKNNYLSIVKAISSRFSYIVDTFKDLQS
jgi:hypothetical protein